MNKALILFSGGIDSTIVLYWALNRGWEVVALLIDYPSQPKKEREAARKILKKLKVKLIEAKIPFLRNLRDLKKIATKSKGFKNSPGFGYVPMRNMIFYAVAGYYAEILDVNYILAGHTEEDSKTYSDDSKEFFRLIESTYNQSLSRSYISENKNLKIILPLIGLSDSDTVMLGQELKVPFHMTWSCWNDVNSPCKTCFACKQRKSALSNIF